ncbi:50S ribosomal protein L1 [Patescibacteria group bacterium]|nr:50S ribosomal protein L1 [Patescibacteria group bacterium]
MTKEQSVGIKAKNKGGRRYAAASQLIDKSKIYSLTEAIDLLKKMPATKFDASIEAHFGLGVDVKQANQQVRGSAVLPHGLGKQKRVAVFCSEDKVKAAKEAGAVLVGGEELIKEIQTTGRCDFDIAVATPDIMRQLAPIAKILGQKGLMPNPKTETITPDVVQAVKELSKGKINFKLDSTGNLHQMVGKLSFDATKLADNISTLLEAIKRAKPAATKGTYIRSFTLCTSMGPAIKVSSV